MDKMQNAGKGTDRQQCEELVCELQGEEHNSVLLCKWQGGSSVTTRDPFLPRLKAALATEKNRFVLIMQTKEQEELYLKFGAQSVITFDATHQSTGMPSW